MRIHTLIDHYKNRFVKEDIDDLKFDQKKGGQIFL